MGFWDKLKGLFEEREEVAEEVKEDVKVEEIDSVLEGKEKEIGGEYKTKIEELHKEIDLILEKISEDIGVLDKIDISEKKEQEKLKDIVSLSKRDYVFQARKFVELLGEDKKAIGKEIEKFLRQSSKSYMKANFLIGQELGNIKEGIVKIKKLNEDFARDNSELIFKREKIKEFLKKNKNRKNKEKIKREIEKKILENEEFCKEFDKKLIEIGKKVEEIKSGSDYKEREKLIVEKEEIEKKLKDGEGKVKELLDRKVLEKYIHLDLDGKKVAEKYVLDCAGSFLEDSDLEIIGIIGEVRKKILSGEINIKNSQKFLEKLCISREGFVSLQDELNGLREKVGEMDSKIKEIKLGLDDFFKEKIEIENRIISLKSQIDVMEKKKGKVVGEIKDLNAELVSAGGI